MLRRTREPRKIDMLASEAEALDAFKSPPTRLKGEGWEKTCGMISYEGRKKHAKLLGTMYGTVSENGGGWGGRGVQLVSAVNLASELCRVRQPARWRQGQRMYMKLSGSCTTASGRFQGSHTVQDPTSSLRL